MTQVPDEPDEVVYGTAVVLIGLVLAVNSLSIGLRVYLQTWLPKGLGDFATDWGGDRYWVWKRDDRVWRRDAA